MDQHVNVNSQQNEAPFQALYIIQLDPNAQIEAQPVPVNYMQNSNVTLQSDKVQNGYMLLNEKQIQGMPMLIIEPVALNNQCLNTQAANINKNNHMFAIPPSSTIESKNQVQNYAAPQKTDEKNSEAERETLVNVEKENTHNSKQHTTTKVVDDLLNKVIIEGTNPPKQKIKNYLHISDVEVRPRAVAVLPTVLQIRGKWISPRRTLSARVRFGPVKGIRTTITRSQAKELVSNSTAPVFLLRLDEDHVTHIDVSDKDKSNWIGLLPLGEEATLTSASTANVWLYEESNELYVLTVLPINSRRPLKLGYSKKYAEEHSIQGSPVFDLEIGNSTLWWCTECNRSLPSASLFERHTDGHHKEAIISRSTTAAYRCRHCKRAFSRFFSMKRHMQQHCVKKPKKSLEKVKQPPEPEPDINSVLEDNRIPSDESFQNFTNSLDFSTNLFDTDRMAGLDLTTNSRADYSELIPYSVVFRDDNELSNDLDFTRLSNENVQIAEGNKEKQDPILESCVHCNQVVVRENKNKHLRQCPSRLICECGRVFRHKPSLAQHIAKCHSKEKRKEKPEDDQPEASKLKEHPFECKECNLRFKRRGILGNHLWRIHKVILTIPVEKKVRHYPCVACSKIYSSSNKRNTHMLVHHPGVETVRDHSIDGGVKSCPPASCTECPRQYGTRAKLLQHMRANHPHLEKTMKSINPKKRETKSKTKSSNKDAVKETNEATNPTVTRSSNFKDLNI